MNNISFATNTWFSYDSMTGTFSPGYFTPPPNKEYGMHTQMDTTENQYFIPSIEDIRVGYEIESHEWSMDEAGEPELNYDRWVKKILDKNDVQNILKYGMRSVRVPYLTKEQIEAEGWKITGREVKPPPYEVDWINAKKGEHTLWINLAMHKVMHLGISDKIYNVFRGQCKDINTFRYICKLLNI